MPQRKRMIDPSMLRRCLGRQLINAVERARNRGKRLPGPLLVEEAALIRVAGEPRLQAQFEGDHPLAWVHRPRAD